MGHHGWGGDPPRTEVLARSRILEAANRCIERAGVAKTTLSDVATEVGVTRQTVYRYYPNLAELLHAVAESGAAAFMTRMRTHLERCDTPDEVVVEAIAFCVEELPGERKIAPLLQAEGDLFGRGITSPTGISLAAAFLSDLPTDWESSGVRRSDLEGLAELMLRLIGSLVQHPPAAPRSPDDVREQVRRWLRPALAPPPGHPGGSRG